VANILKYYVAYRQYAALGREKGEAKQALRKG